MEKKMHLNDGWKLAFFSNAEVREKAIDFRFPEDFDGVKTIDASVPGNFELDFQKAGLIDEPFFGDNIVKLRQFENLHLWYFREFDLPDGFGERLVLDFEGIDTVADIYINGVKKHAENMLIPHRFDVTEILKEKKNGLVVHVFPSVIAAREGEFSPSSYAMAYEGGSVALRKAASTFGWDIMARAVSGGLWKPVYLISQSETRFEEVYAYTRAVDLSKKCGEISVFYKFVTADDTVENRYTVRVHGSLGTSSFFGEQKVWHTAGTMHIEIADCRFWWPKNYGEPNLYDVTVDLVCDGKTVDTKRFAFGIRTVVLERTSVERRTDSNFLFRVNGTPVFCLGTNWVPLDAYHSRDLENLPRALDLLDAIGCNTIRLWGGNVYENDELYDWCDRNGVMVWQDFGMGCAVYPQSDAFCAKIREEGESVVKRLRNHACIILWAGDNEVDLAYGWNAYRRDPNDNLLTRKVLAEVTREQDMLRPYLPSSPYIDEEAYRSNLPTTEDHLWGPRDYFKGDFYLRTECHFASETGYHGCPAPSSLAKFIRPEQLWPILDENGCPGTDWILHGTQPDADRNGPFGYRTELMMNQVKVLFGEMPEDLDTFCRMSQISQAEAVKFFIERFRLSKWRRTGIIWWNLIDGWPQVSDAVVDYYGKKKIAYSYIKRSQNPLCLMFDEPENGKIKLYAVNDTVEDKTADYTVTRYPSGEVLLSGTASAPSNASVCIGEYAVRKSGQEYLKIVWNGGQINHYVVNLKDVDYREYLDFMIDCGFDLWEGFEGR